MPDYRVRAQSGAGCSCAMCHVRVDDIRADRLIPQVDIEAEIPA